MNTLRITTANLILAALFAISTDTATAQTDSEQPTTTAPDYVFEVNAAPSSALKLVPTTAAEMLDLKAARNYMLTLINRDRATVGAPPVVLDDVANAAGQEHSDEMAVNGYLGHWGLDGRKPDQRYAEVGGRDADGENVIGDDEGPKWLLSSSQVFSKTRMEEDEGALFGEKPPDDGHRVNIIDPLHTSVGIGLSRAEGEYPRVSCSQEFIDHYGEYSDIPHALRRNGKFTLTGKLIKGAHIQCVDLRWEDFPKSMTADEINKTSAYGIPDTPTFAYFPEDDQHPVAVSTVGDHQEFSLDVATDKSWKPGLYYVVVWAYLTAVKEPQNISTRTFLLEPAK